MKYQTHFTFNLSNSGQRAAFLTFLLLVLCVTAYAQVGIGTNAPNDKAQLDIVSSNKGILIPRIGESIKEAMTDIPEGLLIYQTDGDAGFYYFTGSVWEKLVPASSITPPSTIIPYASGTPIALSVNVDGTPNIHSIVGFGSNVSQTTP